MWYMTTHRLIRLQSAAIAAGVTLAVGGIVGAGAAPLPISPTGKHATGLAATNQRVRDLDSRLTNAEAVTAWVQRCIAGAELDPATGRRVLVVANDPTCTRSEDTDAIPAR